ncbi:MAG: capsule assembly Wzi family protein, partial [Treponema sp.]|nr:capsule assembly Wzi family protein [Treponema sp.]
ISYSMFLYASTKTPGNEHTLPGAYSPFPDLVTDNANIGPFKMMQNWTSALGVGRPDFYFQAGLNRTSIGPFYDNGVVAGPQAARAGHFSLNYRRPKWSFEMLMLALSASDDFGNEMFPEKFLVFHSFNFNPWPNFEFGFLESVVWGGRLEPLYFVPFTNLFAAQSLSGDFSDNSFLGFHIRWNAPYHIQANAQFYVDDFHFNDIVRLQFNTKYKLAAEAGLVWAPDSGPLSALAADYTMVFPYMYTHWNNPDSARYAGGPNYLNYSHMGRNLGTDLEPNSDRISIRTAWRTLPNLDLSFNAYFTRHANASDNVPAGGYVNSESPEDRDEYHTGTIFDDGDTTEGNNYSYLRFLIQDNIDTRLALGIGVVWTAPTAIGAFSLNADYVLEYGWNRNLEKDNNGLNNYWSIGASWRW